MSRSIRALSRSAGSPQTATARRFETHLLPLANANPRDLGDERRRRFAFVRFPEEAIERRLTAARDAEGRKAPTFAEQEHLSPVLVEGLDLVNRAEPAAMPARTAAVWPQRP